MKVTSTITFQLKKVCVKFLAGITFAKRKYLRNLKFRFISDCGLGAQVPKQAIQNIGLALGGTKTIVKQK